MEITREFAYKVWEVLVKNANATGNGDGFVRALMAHNTKRPFEFRFIGSLDFGGKVWLDDNKFSVNYYREDFSELREAIVKKTNEELDKLMEENNVKAQ